MSLPTDIHSPHKTYDEVIECVLEKLTEESRWCMGSDAQDESGKEVSPLSPEAARWCARGALKKCVGKDVIPPDLWIRITAASKACYPTRADIVEVNDHVGWKAVIKVFRHALQKGTVSPAEVEAIWKAWISS